MFKHDGLVLLSVSPSQHPVPGPFCCFCWLPGCSVAPSTPKPSCLQPPAVCKCAAVAGCFMSLSSMLRLISLQLCGSDCHKSATKGDPNRFIVGFTDASTQQESILFLFFLKCFSNKNVNFCSLV